MGIPQIIQNGFHQVTILPVGPAVRWRNAAGFEWSLVVDGT